MDNMTRRTFIEWGQPREVSLVVEHDAQVLLRREAGDEVVPDCSGLVGAFGLGGCVGVLAGHCEGVDGLFFASRDADGLWSRHEFPGFQVDGDWVEVIPSSCSRWNGVWGSYRPDRSVIGPVLLAFDGGSIARTQIGVDDLLGRVFVRPGGAGALGVRIGTGETSLVAYDSEEEEVIVDRAQLYHVSDDVGVVPGTLLLVGTPTGFVAYAEISPRGSEALKLASLVGSVWVPLRPNWPGGETDLRPWSISETDDGSLVIDLATTGAGLTRAGYLRMVGTCADAEGSAPVPK